MGGPIPREVVLGCIINIVEKTRKQASKQRSLVSAWFPASEFLF